MVDENVESVRAKLQERSRIGIKKYGVTTNQAKYSVLEWLIHLQEELLDGAVYVEALIAKEQADGE